MAIPYEYGDFTLVRVTDFWLEYPFSDFDDQATKVYRLQCQVNVADYETRAKAANMGSAAGAGVIDLPITDSTARFCSDSAPSSVSGGQLQFVRTFANVPENRVEYTTGIYTSPPVFGSKREPSLFITPEIVAQVRRYEYTKTPSKSVVVPIRLEYSYTTSPASVNVKTEEGFEITKSDSTTYPSSYAGQSVTEINEGTSIITATGDAGVIQGTAIRQWMGDIYEVRTGYRV